MASEARRLKTKAQNKAWRTPEARALRALYPHGDGCLSRDTSGGICDCDALRLRREHSAKEVAVAPAGLDATATRAVLDEGDTECNACGAPLDGDCDHCCVACLDGNVCPACEPKPPAPRVLVKVLPHGIGLPAYQTPGAAGLDLCAAWDDEIGKGPARIAGTIDVRDKGVVEVDPDATVSIPTGITVAIPPGWEGQVRGRSGLLFRHGVHVPQIGTIDSDYRGEIRVALRNTGDRPFTIRRGDRIAQLVIAPAPQAVLEQVDELPPTQRGEGGFGSTGVGGGR